MFQGNEISKEVWWLATAVYKQRPDPKDDQLRAVDIGGTERIANGLINAGMECQGPPDKSHLQFGQARPPETVWKTGVPR